MRLSSFLQHCETDFFPNFFYCSSHQFLILCNRLDVQKSQCVPPFLFFGTMRLTGNFKKIPKQNSDFFSLFSFLRAFVVLSCRKSGFRLFEPEIWRGLGPFAACLQFGRGCWNSLSLSSTSLPESWSVSDSLFLFFFEAFIDFFLRFSLFWPVFTWFSFCRVW